MIDDIEIGQGYCVTAPCWMYATGRVDLAEEWERENPGFWAKADLDCLCEHCGCELDGPNEPCEYCDEADA